MKKKGEANSIGSQTQFQESLLKQNSWCFGIEKGK